MDRELFCYSLLAAIILTCVTSCINSDQKLPTLGNFSGREVPPIVQKDTLEVRGSYIRFDDKVYPLKKIMVCGHRLHLSLGTRETITILSVPPEALLVDENIKE